MKAIDLGLSVFWGETLLEIPNKHYEERLFTWGDDTYNFEHKNRYEDYVDYEELVNNGIISENGYLSTKYDHASRIMGDKWRLPTIDEFKELINKCKWTWVEDGYTVTGPNKNFIKIPHIVSYRDTGRKYIEDIWYIGEIEKPIMAKETKCYWSSEPSYDMTADGLTNEAYALFLSCPESSLGIRLISEHRYKKNFIIPVTSDKTFVKANDDSPIRPQVKKPWFMDTGDIDLEDDYFTDATPPPIIPNGTYFPLPLWDKLPQAAKDYLIEVWGIDNENEYNKLLHDADSIAIIEHNLKCRGII